MSIRFLSEEHRRFFFQSLAKTKKDVYHQSFFYLLGLTEETRAQIHTMFDFSEDCIKPDGLGDSWQTDGTLKVCRLACNLWNGYCDRQQGQVYTPEDLFACAYAPYFMEAIRLRYPEYLPEIRLERQGKALNHYAL